MFTEILIILALISIIFIATGISNVTIQLDRIADLINSTEAFGEEYENTTKDQVLDLYNKMLNMTGEEPINKSKVSFSDGICETGNPLYLEKLFPDNYCHEV